MGNLRQILEEEGVRLTPVRQLIFSQLQNSDVALSLSDLEALLETVDKSSISRNLHLFLQAGLIHQIIDGSGVAKYAPTPVDAGETHAHFTCRKCGETICLDASPLPPQPLPHGFVAEGYNLVIKGICSHCKR